MRGAIVAFGARAARRVSCQETFQQDFARVSFCEQLGHAQPLVVKVHDLDPVRAVFAPDEAHAAVAERFLEKAEPGGGV